MELDVILWCLAASLMTIAVVAQGIAVYHSNKAYRLMKRTYERMSRG